MVEAQEVFVPLYEGWSFRQVGKEKWYPARVPGTVHDDLLRQGLIPDPMRNSNVDSVQWIELEDWTYRRTITVGDTLFKYANIDLVFRGLDTFAEVYLNDSLLGKADNMFRSWEWPIKDLLKLGENELKVIFRSTIKEGAKLRDAYGIQLPHDNDPSGVSPYVRKAAYQFGWDFAPRLVGCGIWREVGLSCGQHKPIYITGATIKRLSQYDRRNKDLVLINPQVIGTRRESTKVRISIDGKPIRGQNFLLPHNERWLPEKQGAKTLHSLRIELKDGKRTKHSWNDTFGVRNTYLSQKEDSIGGSFEFISNGKPFPIRGCNIIPPSIHPNGNMDHQWVSLVREVARAGMNMVRVWAGGVYPPKAFYYACDTAGILVWQDFMFANLTPTDPEFMNSVGAEVAENLVRLTPHPSLELLCGNNELNVAWINWGWQKTYRLSTQDSMSIEGGLRQMQHLFWLTTAASTDVQIVPTSPLSNWGNAEGLKSGDLHYWGVWHGDSAFSSFANNVGRFVSEYGFQSYPDSITLAHYIDPEFLYLGSPMLAKRQKSYKTDKPIWTAIERELGETPTTLGRFIDCSQVVQAEAYRQAIWAHRTNQPHCMGTLYWQLNDVWAAPTWSTIDVDSRWKAAHFEVKRSYAERVLAFVPNANGTTTLELWSDTEVLGDTVMVEFWSVQGELVRREKKPLTGKGRLVVGSWPKAAWEAGMMAYAFGADTEPRMYSTMNSSNGNQRKDGLSMASVPGQTDVWEVRTTSPIRTVKLVVGPDDHVSDNWFPLVPGHPVRIKVEHGVRSTGQVPTASIFRR
ncbi:MAG: hypothetical protein KA230_07685 [Flavobacteriales bacterium]|nr:hypothetical protein [Flavobacteriales bacterium]